MKQSISEKKNSFIYQMEPWIGKEEQEAVYSYLGSGGWLTEFKKTTEFERMIAEFLGVKHACVMTNGTVTLFAALQALGIGVGDEVIVPNFSMIASANAVVLTGAKPILVDIVEKDLCIDFDLVERAITGKTKALMFVSLNGRSPDMYKVVSFCKKHKLYLIEDAAQSLGSKWNGKYLGTFGEIGSFSFSTPKVITTGQGGALVTDSNDLIKKIRQIKDFGRVKSGVDKHIALGYNFKFTDLQAVIGIEQMKKLSTRIKRKKEIYHLYQIMLSNVKGIKFIQTNLENTSPWFVDVLADRRDQLIQYLLENNIGTRTFYTSINTQAPYSRQSEYKDKSFPVSEEISVRGLWLPSSLFLNDETISDICKVIRKFYS